jgi:histidyl-tRNA synthetase
MINIPKGTKDVLPQDSYKWQYLEDIARKTAKLFNLKEIRTPVFEYTELFLRGVGDTTDIVNKEMYTFLDKGNRSITLKPEGTAGVARSFIENGMASGVLPAKMFYFTPVFRYERPQAGRLREHHQFGIEMYGGGGADMDAEVILIASTFLKNVGIQNLSLNINSIGCKNCRADYNNALKSYLQPQLEKMCTVCQSRFEKNPLRILDCKEENCKKINKNAPKITDYLCEDCSIHFENLKKYLSISGLEYTINPYIVRGLDYYSKTVFEFVSNNIGSQSTVCGGGRYDTLIEEIGGSSMAGVGFGLGLERLLLLMDNTGVVIPDNTNVTLYIANIGQKAYDYAYKLTNDLRALNISAELDHMSRGIKPQFKYADKIKAKFVIVIGEDELNNSIVNIKDMTSGAQTQVQIDKVVDFFAKTY